MLFKGRNFDPQQRVPLVITILSIGLAVTTLTNIILVEGQVGCFVLIYLSFLRAFVCCRPGKELRRVKVRHKT